MIFLTFGNISFGIDIHSTSSPITSVFTLGNDFSATFPIETSSNPSNSTTSTPSSTSISNTDVLPGIHVHINLQPSPLLNSFIIFFTPFFLLFYKINMQYLFHIEKSAPQLFYGTLSQSLQFQKLTASLKAFCYFFSFLPSDMPQYRCFHY